MNNWTHVTREGSHCKPPLTMAQTAPSFDGRSSVECAILSDKNNIDAVDMIVLRNLSKQQSIVQKTDFSRELALATLTTRPFLTPRRLTSVIITAYPFQEMLEWWVVVCMYLGRGPMYHHQAVALPWSSRVFLSLAVNATFSDIDKHTNTFIHTRSEYKCEKLWKTEIPRKKLICER